MRVWIYSQMLMKIISRLFALIYWNEHGKSQHDKKKESEQSTWNQLECQEGVNDICYYNNYPLNIVVNFSAMFFLETAASLMQPPNVNTNDVNGMIQILWWFNFFFRPLKVKIDVKNWIDWRLKQSLSVCNLPFMWPNWYLPTLLCNKCKYFNFPLIVCLHILMFHLLT